MTEAWQTSGPFVEHKSALREALRVYFPLCTQKIADGEVQETVGKMESYLNGVLPKSEVFKRK